MPASWSCRTHVPTAMALVLAAVIAHLPGILVLVPSKDLLARALEIAQTLDHPIYDCFYAAAAERWEAPLVTDDRKFVAALRKSKKIKVEVRPLGAAA